MQVVTTLAVLRFAVAEAESLADYSVGDPALAPVRVLVVDGQLKIEVARGATRLRCPVPNSRVETTPPAEAGTPPSA